MFGSNGNGSGGHGAPPVPDVIAKLSFVRSSAWNGVPHGVKSVCEVYTPHCTGVDNAACAPPLKDNLNFVNGSCGVSANVVVIRPVPSSKWILPISFR